MWNFIGQAIPLIVALVAIPILVQHLGTARFGVLTLVWVVLGYFSLFDLGLGRALTHMLARQIGLAAGDRPSNLHEMVWTALLVMLALGVLAGTALTFVAPWAAHHLLKVPTSLQDETASSLYLVATAVPLVVVSAGLRGILEASQQFGHSSWIRTLLGFLTFGGPVLVLPFSSRLEATVATLIVARALACIAYFWICRRLFLLASGISFDAARVLPLLRLGGWMTVSNTISPLMVYADRFLIGITLSVVAVSYYAIPYELVTKLWVIVGALTGVLFPAFSASLVIDTARARLLFRRGLKYTTLILFPMALSIVVLAPEGLNFWLGSSFQLNSTRVLQLLTIGVFVNSLGQVSFALVQAAGRADLTAKLHLVEFPIYAISLIWLLNAAGINGAAIAWLIRVSIDTAILFLIVTRLLPNALTLRRSARPLILVCLAALGLGQAITSPTYKAIFLISGLIGFAVVGWRWLSPAERAFFRPRLIGAPK